MRTYFVKTESRYKAFKECPFVPAKVAKVAFGYMCFESENDYQVWKIKNR